MYVCYTEVLPSGDANLTLPKWIWPVIVLVIILLICGFTGLFVFLYWKSNQKYKTHDVSIITVVIRVFTMPLKVMWLIANTFIFIKCELF